MQVHKDLEAKEARLKLHGWEYERRVIITRRKLSGDSIIGIETEEVQKSAYHQLSFIDGPEDIKVFEYSVLVTDLSGDIPSIFQHYRDQRSWIQIIILMN